MVSDSARNFPGSWRPYQRSPLAGFWDFVFVFSNFLLAILFGAAGGNLVRGVPLDANGNFSMAFFSNFNVRGYVGLLDWYTVSIALSRLVILAAHGATYLTLKTEGPVHDRSTMWGKVPLGGGCTALSRNLGESWVVRPDLPGHAIHHPFCWLGLLVAIVSIVMLISGLSTHREVRAFLGSNGLLVGLLAHRRRGYFPRDALFDASAENSLTAYAVAANPRALHIASIWWPMGFVLAITYFVFISLRYAGKVSLKRDTQGFY